MSKHPPPAAGENTAVAKRSKAASAKQAVAAERDFQNPFAVFSEWAGEADEKAYADL